MRLVAVQYNSFWLCCLKLCYHGLHHHGELLLLVDFVAFGVHCCDFFRDWTKVFLHCRDQWHFQGGCYLREPLRVVSNCCIPVDMLAHFLLDVTLHEHSGSEVCSNHLVFLLCGLGCCWINHFPLQKIFITYKL